jgi:hypothetical protein
MLDHAWQANFTIDSLGISDYMPRCCTCIDIPFERKHAYVAAQQAKEMASEPAGDETDPEVLLTDRAPAPAQQRNGKGLSISCIGGLFIVDPELERDDKEMEIGMECPVQMRRRKNQH